MQLKSMNVLLAISLKIQKAKKGHVINQKDVKRARYLKIVKNNIVMFFGKIKQLLNCKISVE